MPTTNTDSAFREQAEELRDTIANAFHVPSSVVGRIPIAAPLEDMPVIVEGTDNPYGSFEFTPPHHLSPGEYYYHVIPTTGDVLGVDTVTPATATLPTSPVNVVPDPLEMGQFQRLYEEAKALEEVPFLREDLEQAGFTAEGRRIGIELEVLLGENARPTAEALYEAGFTAHRRPQGYHEGQGEDDDVWRMEHDSSCDKEIISPPLLWTVEDWDSLHAILSILAQHGARTDRTTGLHTHHGIWHRYNQHPERIATFTELVYRSQDILFRVGATRAGIDHRGHGYCAPIERNSSAPHFGHRYARMGEPYDLARTFGHYNAINGRYCNDGHNAHVEFRYADGRLPAGEIQAIMKLNAALVRAGAEYPVELLASAFPNRQLGSHYQNNRSERRLEGTEWEQQSAQVRHLLPLLFRREIDMLQFLSLFCRTRWQTGGRTRLVTGVKLSPQEEAAVRERLLRLHLETRPQPTIAQAHQAAALIRNHGGLSMNVTNDEVTAKRSEYLMLLDGGNTVVGTTRLWRASWYQHELSRAALDPSLPAQEAMRPLAMGAVERAREAGALRLQATIRSNQSDLRSVLDEAGFVSVGTFQRGRTGNQGEFELLAHGLGYVTPEPVRVPDVYGYTRPRRTLKEGSAPSLWSIESEDHARQAAAIIAAENDLENPPSASYVWNHRDDYLTCRTRDGLVVGTARLRRVSWYQAEVMHLALAPAFQGYGYAPALLNGALQRARTLGLKTLQCTVRVDNQPMRRLLRRTGWMPVADLLHEGRHLEVWMMSVSILAYSEAVLRHWDAVNSYEF